MFNKARIRLTLWYMLIIFVISSFFSVAFYHASTREVRRVLNRIERRQQIAPIGDRGFHSPAFAMNEIEELKISRFNLLSSLLVINGFILIVSGAAAYFLAGRTLKPISDMVDEQNIFISNSSHELRTPLASLRAEMEASLLEKHISDTEARKLIRSNLEDISRLQTLSDNLLQIINLHKPAPTKHSTSLPVEAMILSAIKLVKPLANKKKITIIPSIENGYVSGDKDRLKELMVILLDNAIKYSTEKSKVRVKVKTTKRSVRIIVKDRGIGIVEDELEKVFKRFFRSDTSRSKTKGFGLGLSIAKQIVEAHKGKIKVKSTVGKGTTVMVELPLVKP